MVNTFNRSATARQVELIIRQLESLSTLPEIATGFLTSVTDDQFDTATVIEIIESDLALTAKVFSLAHDEGIIFNDDKPTVRQAVSKLPRQMVRDAILSIKIFENPAGKSAETNTVPRKELALHALATACCADQIAKLVLEPEDRALAYTAGLLHDIGKLAIAEVMPKSFERITAEAKDSAASLAVIEQKHLGIDHTIIGKRLAEKWHLPARVGFAIWLHHSDTEALSENMEAGRLAQVVRLADTIVRQEGIGISGSCDNPNSLPEILQSLRVSHEQIENIKHDLHRAVEKKTRTLGLNNFGADKAYSQVLRETAAQLADNNRNLISQNRGLSLSSAHMGLISEFLQKVTPRMSSIEASELFAAAWKKHYQTGPVCVLLDCDPESDIAEVTAVCSGSKINTILASKPTEGVIVPKAISKKFAVIPAAENCQWLFEQIDIEIDPAKTYLVPLAVDSHPVGVLLFEHRSPADPAEQTDSLSVAANIAARVIAMTKTSQKHQGLSEQLVGLLGQLKVTRDKLAENKAYAGIAEMAAGAAHELNNPLAVISGRTQLLLDIETDDNKKQMLKQINERTADLAKIIEDLMGFARPSTPKQANITVDELIDAAVRQTQIDHNIRTLELTRFGIDELSKVNVDAEQVVAAIKNIISNALDSYSGGNGPITVTTDCPQEDDFVTIQIIDSGCGMDVDTLAKAVEPFFSGKPAGRKRGMGLSHAKRLLELNKCNLKLASKPEQGTTVTITMPK